MPDDTAVVEETEISAADQAVLDDAAFEEEFYSEEPTEAAKSTQKEEPAAEATEADDEGEAKETPATETVATPDATPAADSAAAMLAKLAESVDVDADETAAADATTVDSTQADALAEMQAKSDAAVKEANERAEAAEAALAKATAESNVISLEDIPTIDAFMDKLPSGDLKSELVEAAEDDPKLARLIMAAAVAFSSKSGTESDAVSSLRAELNELKAESTSLRDANSDREAQVQYALDVTNGFTGDDGVVWKGHADANEVAASAEFQTWLNGRSESEQNMAKQRNRVYSHVLLDAFKESLASDEVNRQTTVKDNKDALLSGGVKSTKAEGGTSTREKSAEQEFDEAWEEEGKLIDAENEKRKAARTV